MCPSLCFLRLPDRIVVGNLRRWSGNRLFDFRGGGRWNIALLKISFQNFFCDRRRCLRAVAAMFYKCSNCHLRVGKWSKTDKPCVISELFLLFLREIAATVISDNLDGSGFSTNIVPFNS